MKHLVLVWLGIVFPLLAGASTSLGYEEQRDRPTAGGEPVFATEADVLLNTVKNLIDAQDYQAAEKLAEQLTATSPDMVDGWMMLGYARSLNGKYDLSNAAYDRALDMGANPKDVLLRKAYNCRKLDDPRRTRQCFEALLALEKSPEILVQFGAFESATENYAEALRLFTEALEMKPDDLEVIDAITRVEEKRGDSAQLKYWLEKGLAVEPANTRFLKRLSLVYLNEQNYDLSVNYLKKLLAVDPENSGAYRNMGIAYYQLGDKERAKAAFEKVKTFGGAMDGLYGPLADCYRSTGQRTAALAVIQEGIEQRDQEAWLYSVWGKLLEDEQDYDAAIGKFAKAVELQEEPWSGYAKKQIARQEQLKKRAELIAQQKEG